MYEHFKAVQDVGLPVILYCNSARSGAHMTLETVISLAKLPHIVGWKEATGSLVKASDVIKNTDLAVLSGDDALTLPIMAIGGTGVTSVLSNLAPEHVVAITDAVRRGDYEAARRAHYACTDLLKTLFVEVNPQPLKKGMELLGFCSAACRLPLVEASQETADLVETQLRNAKLL
ncbi:hypothetical protein AC1031_017601 [Aphanomyces cochlioides]|nr:hypothetical protein AC1031_017601 [Aphanomyces cochlioides]